MKHLTLIASSLHHFLALLPQRVNSSGGQLSFSELTLSNCNTQLFLLSNSVKFSKVMYDQMRFDFINAFKQHIQHRSHTNIHFRKMVVISRNPIGFVESLMPCWCVCIRTAGGHNTHTARISACHAPKDKRMPRKMLGSLSPSHRAVYLL
jgi:hypothetical protein